MKNKVCPGCGRCNACGRGGPAQPYPYPYPIYYYPNGLPRPYYGTITVNGQPTTNVLCSTT